ncbi:hypothetical protein HDV00_009815 [Rhizophlyctis rosea]|nr:hypothetical protein HDV00_009815 [Rhizophlyctis rosea]
MTPRTSSRYNLSPTNKSLKFAMEEFQTLKGHIGTIHLPDCPTPLSLKKHGRWKYVNNHVPDPAWGLPSDTDPIYLESFHLRGYWCNAIHVNTQNSGQRPVIVVNRIGRAVGVRGRGRKVRYAGNGPVPVVGDTVVDERYRAFSAACCCGCSMCSVGRPRGKALKKTKGRRKWRDVEMDEGWWCRE